MAFQKKTKKRTQKDRACSPLKGSYTEIWEYMRETRNYIWFVLALFAVFCAVGFVFPVFFVEEIQEFVKQLIEATAGLNAQQMIWFIFKNNAWSSFIAIIAGAVFGILPAISAIANGYMLGFVSDAVVSEVGYLSLWRLLPHGIFEIPAVLISLGLGMKFGMSAFAKKPAEEFKRRFFLSMKAFLLVVLPLLIVAAIIEGSLIVLLG